LFTKCESIVNAYFTEVSIPAISLRVDGIVRPISSWDQLQHKFTLSANQLMEIKLATYNFKRDENRKYDQIVRRLNKPNESPIHFAFTTDYGIRTRSHIPSENAHFANRSWVCIKSRTAMLSSHAEPSSNTFAHFVLCIV
jgi:hypothetical protein